MNKKKRLGRGLEALLSVVSEPAASPIGLAAAMETGASDKATGSTTSDIVHLSVYEIEDNPFQPRREFSESEISSLAESLKEHDILQPILVRIVNDRYQLISGERRLRAAIQANWQTIPARIRVADDRLVAELAIVENLQRKDLNPIEKAMSFRRYIDQHGCTQEDLASRLKIDRSTVANLMRLLELPDVVQNCLRQGAISAGHARALLPLGEEAVQVEFCERIQKDQWSVRETERLVGDRIRDEDDHHTIKIKPAPRRAPNAQIESIEKQLKLALGTKVRIRKGPRGRGTIQIEFSNAEEFDRIRRQIAGAGDTEMRRAA